MRFRIAEIIDDALGARRADAGASVGTCIALATLNRVVEPCSKLPFADWWAKTAGDRWLRIPAGRLVFASSVLVEQWEPGRCRSRSTWRSRSCRAPDRTIDCERLDHRCHDAALVLFQVILADRVHRLPEPPVAIFGWSRDFGPTLRDLYVFCGQGAPSLLGSPSTT